MSQITEQQRQCRHDYERIRHAEYRDEIEICHRCRVCGLLDGYRYDKASRRPFDSWQGTPPDNWGFEFGRID